MGLGQDELFGDAGDDLANAIDGQTNDRVDCGPGDDDIAGIDDFSIFIPIGEADFVDQGDGGRYAMVGGTLLWLWLASDKLGSYLFARRGVPRGRGLRAFGTVAFFPLSMGFYLAASWAASTVLFAVQSAAVGILFAWAILRRARPGRDHRHA